MSLHRCEPARGDAKSEPVPIDPLFFASADAFRAWLHAHAATRTEPLVGFHKVDSGRPSMTWPQAVDEALCVGWIDGVRKRIDDFGYTVRFTARKSASIRSAVNIGRVDALLAAGRMTAAGLAAYERRTEGRSKVYAYEQGEAALLAPAEEKAFRRHRSAWAFFERQPPGCRQRVPWRMVAVARAAIRARRLAALIAACAEGQRP